MNYNLKTQEGMANAMLWQEAHLALIRDGGVWVVPRSGTMYKIDHKNKVAIRMGLFLEPDITRVFEKIGWTVKEMK